MKVMLISGSPAAQSNTRFMSRYIETQLNQTGAEVLVFDVGKNILPLFTGEESNHPEVQRLLQYAHSADAFYICTPEYHNGISGALKNALDFLDSPHFQGKPVAISAAAGGGKGGINALNQLRLIIRALYGIVIPEQTVCDPKDFDSNGGLVNPDAIARLDKVVRRLCVLQCAMRALESATL